MSYATTANRANPLAALGAMGIPAAVGALLVVGLAVTATIPDEDTPFEGFTVKVDPIEPPPPQPVDKATPDTSSKPAPDPVEQYTPAPRPTGPIDLGMTDVGPTNLPGTGAGLGDIGTIDLGGVDLRPGPSFDPVDASPRGDPGSWITVDDYRSSWIAREYTGTAGFTLNLDASGRVTGCTITRSTGHDALDNATCSLLTKRARFTPARNSSGEAVAGRFSSTVRWQIPD